MIWFVLVAGLYNVLIALVIKTKNFSSSLIFKVIPFFLGAACMIHALKVLGWI